MADLLNKSKSLHIVSYFLLFHKLGPWNVYPQQGKRWCAREAIMCHETSEVEWLLSTTDGGGEGSQGKLHVCSMQCAVEGPLGRRGVWELCTFQERCDSWAVSGWGFLSPWNILPDESFYLSRPLSHAGLITRFVLTVVYGGGLGLYRDIVTLAEAGDQVNTSTARALHANGTDWTLKLGRLLWLAILYPCCHTAWLRGSCAVPITPLGEKTRILYFPLNSLIAKHCGHERNSLSRASSTSLNLRVVLGRLITTLHLDFQLDLKEWIGFQKCRDELSKGEKQCDRNRDYLRWRKSEFKNIREHCTTQRNQWPIQPDFYCKRHYIISRGLVGDKRFNEKK